MSVSVLIPTRADDPGSARLDHVLQSLLFQTLPTFSILIRDEGSLGALESRATRQFVDLLARRGVEVAYQRVPASSGIAEARRRLLEEAGDRSLLCFVDDDMCLAPDALQRLVDAAAAHPDCGFLQGQKIEADSGRRYWNDINRLNGRSSERGHFRIWFGDAALLLLRPEALSLVDWELVTRYRVEGLPGEDVAMTLMIADRLECFGVPEAVGYHLSPARTRWLWEASSDVLQLELLRTRVSPETLRRALPHLADQIG